jgi:hypothetical protein
MSHFLRKLDHFIIVYNFGITMKGSSLLQITSKFHFLNYRANSLTFVSYTIS